MRSREFSLFDKSGNLVPENRGGLSFVQSTRLSLLAHIIIIFLLIIAQLTPRSREIDLSEDMDAFMQAYHEASTELDMKSVYSNLQEAFKNMGGGGLLGLDLDYEEKVEFYKQLFRVIAKGEFSKEQSGNSSLDSLLDALRAEGVELESGDKVFPGTPSIGKEEPQFKTLPKAEQETLKRLKRLQELERNNARIQGGDVIIESEAGLKYIPVDYYFRKSPYEAILTQGAKLFYIVDGFPVINLDDENPPEKAPEPDFDLVRPGFGFQTRVILIENTVASPLAVQKPESLTSSERKILQLPEGRIQKILNGLMTFNESRQMDYFSREFLMKYHPDTEQLARLTYEFIHNNLANLVIVYHPIAGAYGFIEQIYFNRPLDETFHGYYLAHPDSKTSVEFLFALASHINFEKRAVQYLFAAYELARKAAVRKYYKTDVYNKRVKAYILKRIYEDFRKHLYEKGYETLDDILVEYSLQERKIYETIISQGGRQEMRGLYALGVLYWEDEVYDLAMETWKKINSEYDNPAFRRIKSIYSDPGNSKAEIITRINGVLAFEAQNGNQELMERLLKYRRWDKRMKPDPDLL